ncbi:TPA: NACHT domain-containing protein [Clostridioides difficile]|uniref:NACHT domain-containing protein n=1 Tax=Clostridioides difficile TaxID=1496 RepID=UPI001C17D1D6|nr:NACHT domain-containing protein [Clostridioides difficile]
MEAELCAQAIIVASKVVKATGVDEMIKDLVKTHLGNRLEGFFEKQEDKKELELIENKFSEYMIRSYKNHIYMNTIVNGNQQKTIDDLYIPLTVAKKVRRISNKENQVEILVDRYNEEFIPKYKKIILIDNAGMGKSTIAKYLYLSVINENKGIPIFIELRKLSYEEDVMDFIMNEINGISEHFDKDNVLKLIERGNFIFFFDGYDEINKVNKMKITSNIQNFISKTGNNTFLMTSREENELASFGDFQSFYIKPLKKEEAYNLIKKYSDNDEEVSRTLIAKIEKDKNFEMIKEFLENPLMVSLLCESFRYKQSIPHKKDAFYRQVYDALFEKHDYSKKPSYSREKKSGLNLEEFHKILRTLGFITLAKGISYCKEELINIVSESKIKNMGIEFNENDLVYDLIHNVPIFIKDGIEYRWAHKSFQEYFAASYICFDSDKKDTLLKKMSNGNKINKYYNVLDFCYDIDYKSFSRYIIYPLLNELEVFCSNKYICDKYKNYNKEDLKLRKSILFKYDKICIVFLNDSERKKLEEDCSLFQFVIDFKRLPTNLSASNLSIFNDEVWSNLHVKKNLMKLMNLLYNKKSLIIEKSLITENMILDIEELMSKIDLEKEYIINDDINNYLNQENTFEAVNNLLLVLEGAKAFDINFNYNKCIAMKKQIEKDIEEEKTDLYYV